MTNGFKVPSYVSGEIQTTFVFRLGLFNLDPHLSDHGDPLITSSVPLFSFILQPCEVLMAFEMLSLLDVTDLSYFCLFRK